MTLHNEKNKYFPKKKMSVSFFFCLLLLSVCLAAVGVPKVNSVTVSSASSFSVDVSGSTKGSGQVYQVVQVVRAGVVVYGSTTTATTFSTSYTTATFSGAVIEPQDVIYHRYYDGATIATATLITSAAATYQAKCLIPTGGSSRACWNSTSGDYCLAYPFDLGGVGGTSAANYAAVASYVGAGYTINAGNGCWSAAALVAGNTSTPLTDIAVGIPAKYMVFASTASNTVSVPLQPYVQTARQSSNVDIAWGDGTVDRNLVSATGVTRTHTYASSGTYVIRIAGTADALCYSALGGGSGAGQLVNVTQWGDVVTHQINFYDELRLGSLVVSTSDSPNPSVANLERLFAVSTTLTTLAPYGTRVSPFTLPSGLVNANDAFPGLNLSAWSSPIALPSSVTSASGTFLRSIVPAVSLANVALSTCSNMFFTASLTSTVTLTNVTCSAASAMFQGATVAGALSLTSTTLVSPVGAFGTSPQAVRTTLASTVSFTSSYVTGDATSMFSSTKWQSATPVSFAGLDVTGVTTAVSMFAAGTFTATPNMTTVSLPAATSAAGAFQMIGAVSNLPALDLRVATDCTGLLYFATVKERFTPSWPLMKCATAVNLMRSATFQLGADLSGVNVSQVVDATSAFQSIKAGVDFVSPGSFSSCTTAFGLFSGAACWNPPCSTWDLTALALPAATNAFAALAFSTSNGTTLSAMDAVHLGSAVDCNSLVRGTFAARFVPAWPSMQCNTSSFMFASTTFPQGADFSGVRVSLITTAPGMFQQSTFQGTNASVFPGPFSAAIDVSSALLSTAFPSATPDTSRLAFPVATNVSALFWGSKADPDLSGWPTFSVLLANANNFIQGAYVSTPARYSVILNLFSNNSTLNGATMGSPYNTTTGTTLQGYDASGSAAHADLTTRGWTLNDAGLI